MGIPASVTPSDSDSHRSDTSDSPTTIEIINAVASIATALGFIMVIIQFWYTRKKDKDDQVRIEEERNNNLLDSQSEQKRMREQFELQLAQSHTQQFEHSLFSLLNLFNQVVLQLKFKDKTDMYGDDNPVEEYGRGVFDEAARRIKRMCELRIMDDPDDSDNPYTHPVKSIAEARYQMAERYHDNYYIYFEEILNHYFRSLYHIFKYIDKSELIKDDRKPYYASIVRSQLSQNELLAIMFNLIIYDYGYPQFLRLDKKYRILENFRHDAPFLKHYYDLYIAIKADTESEDGEDGISLKGYRSLYLDF
ncbi:putative phage abortive infection protein [Chitinophaga tropicalis]|nr:putative phage abortive infection protein [Chitinophaga tropicalis]